MGPLRFMTAGQAQGPSWVSGDAAAERHAGGDISYNAGDGDIRQFEGCADRRRCGHDERDRERPLLSGVLIEFSHPQDDAYQASPWRAKPGAQARVPHAPLRQDPPSGCCRCVRASNTTDAPAGRHPHRHRVREGRASVARACRPHRNRPPGPGRLERRHCGSSALAMAPNRWLALMAHPLRRGLAQLHHVAQWESRAIGGGGRCSGSCAWTACMSSAGRVPGGEAIEAIRSRARHYARTPCGAATYHAIIVDAPSDAQRYLSASSSTIFTQGARELRFGQRGKVA